MLLKIGLGVLALLVLFLGYVSTKDDAFNYERSGVIKAPPEKIYPYISQLKNGHLWSPYEKGLEMPKEFSGTDGQAGSSLKFGPSKNGSGTVTILEVDPNRQVKLDLHMTAPFEAKQLVIYTLTPEADGTRFSWRMEGHGGFLGKLMTTVIDCEKMLGNQMNEGIQNLKALVEGT